MRPFIACAASVALLVAGCALLPSPMPSPSSGDGFPVLSSPVPGSPGVPGPQSSAPDASGIAVDLLVGAWQSTPFALGAAQIAVISDACANAARNDLGAAEADLPTAVVDARGEGFATAILADDTRAIQCLARLDGVGDARIDSVERLAPSKVAVMADHEIGLTSLLQFEDREGGRGFLLGRMGPNASEVKTTLDDKSQVTA
jgi:hypothetical protein